MAIDTYRSTPTAKALPRFATRMKVVQLSFSVGGFAAMMAAAFALIVGSSPQNGPGRFYGFFFLLSLDLLLMMGAVVAMATWLRNVWSWLPASERRAKGWTSTISPTVAWMLALVPTFQFVWAILMSFGINDALVRMREAYGQPRPDDRISKLGIAATFAGFVGALPIAGVLAYLAMARTEEQIAEVQKLSERYERAGMPLTALPPGYAGDDASIPERTPRWVPRIVIVAAAMMGLSIAGAPFYVQTQIENTLTRPPPRRPMKTTRSTQRDIERRRAEIEGRSEASRETPTR